MTWRTMRKALAGGKCPGSTEAPSHLLLLGGPAVKLEPWQEEQLLLAAGGSKKDAGLRPL